MDEHVWVFDETTDQKITEIMKAGDVSRATAMILASRNLPPDQVESFLKPTLSRLSDPFLLSGTEAAAKRLWQAVRGGERILIHGDYDSDGITATALAAWVLRQHGATVGTFLPHRIDDGYGLTVESVTKAKEERWDVMLTVDCGITSVEAAAAAHELGVDLIITDHHMPAGEIPIAVAVVNPKLPGAPDGVEDLAGVGVAFKVCHAFMKYGREHGYEGEELDLRDGLDLVALGTVADIVPLLDENRILVKNGLQVLGRQHRPGVHALCEIARTYEPLGTGDITYRLAPRLNAAGRMGDPSDSLRLLEAHSMVEASALARRLDEYNRERQRIEEEAIHGAEEQIEAMDDLDQRRTLVVAGAGWHQGVVGIVASRLTRRYHRPAVVLTEDASGVWVGSSRSIRGLNLVELLERCSGTLLRFGGHAMAAGLSLELDKLDLFREQFEATIGELLTVEALRPKVEICGEVSFSELDYRFFSELEKLEPFGHGNPEPVFVTRDVIPDKKLPAGRSHTRGYMRDATGASIPYIAFGRTPDTLPPAPWDLAFTPQLNRYGGQSTPQVRVVDIRSLV
ncbi:MAG: single-stranded-DNA-specific exonuclease RecJ [Victivallales bacterium]|nr:single-stranded-DNA-specific exonuclease RecJ [Victivallales bacterium]MBT7304004.1 single-stranded-DNA-specific exonuclease RecJ [Victivallales bacterium]